VGDQDDVRRLNYFTNQFLRAADFQAEQDYHLQQRRRHNQALHTWGIANGLGVEPKLNEQAVTVNAGTAIDSEGREIVLIKPQDIDLPAPPAAITLFVTIAYAEEPANQSTDAGITGHTRWLEKPVIVASTSPPAGTGQQIVLAVVERRPGETAVQVRRSMRHFAGPSASSMSLDELTLRHDDEPTWNSVQMSLGGDRRIVLTGSLNVSEEVTSQRSHVDGSLTVGDSISARRGSIAELDATTLSVGQLLVANPTTFGALTATGDLAVEGSASFAGALTARALATFTGGVEINLVAGRSALVVSGVASFERGLTASGPGMSSFFSGILVAGGITVSAGTTDLTGPLIVSGLATLSGGLKLMGTGALGVNGFSTLSGGLRTGPATIDGALTVNAAANFMNGMTINNAPLTVNNGLTVGAGSTTLGALTVNSTANFNNGTANFNNGVVVSGAPSLRVVGGAITPAIGNLETAGIQFPVGGSGDRAFIRYFVESNETTRLLIGIGNDADDRLSLSQFGAERLTIFNGNVGIGTQTPMRPLHVETNAEVHSRGGYSFSSRPTPTPGGGVSGPLGDFVEDPVTSGAKWLLTANAGVMALSTGSTKVLTSTPAGAVVIPGTLEVIGTLTAKKTGYVIDQFVNNLGDPLDQGDIVIVHDNGTNVSYGNEGQIPIPEVDLTETAYDTRVCGIVEAAYGEMAKPGPDPETGKKPRSGAPLVPRIFDRDERAKLDHTTVQPGQVGAFVTLGAYAHCKVDADIAPIVAGDLLTTSPTKGHAQKVLDRGQATGAIIGKALAGLKKGKGKIPLLVTLG
jgi:hypothetical protein